MSSKSFLIKPLAAAALLAVAGASQASITVYTSQAAFNAATTAQGVDTFTGFSITGSTPSPITRSAGPYGYTGSVTTTSFFGAGTTANPWLSTNTATDAITFNGFTGGVSAVGGNFFGSDISGLFAAGDITLTATDASGSVTQTIVGATTTSFVGFVSTGLMTSLVVSSVQPAAGFLWPTVDNLTLAQAGVVPEPGSYALMFAGLGFLGFMARRRRA
ncbi:MAG: PEP-CTERM sorting domain-containing protein [Rubrivivax sp.]|nr:PEP-CTERM sorting domain-containing protein [Rubrivivax sp.]